MLVRFERPPFRSAPTLSLAKGDLHEHDDGDQGGRGSEGREPSRPRIGVIGIMQGLYDDMLPGISRTPGGVPREIGAALAGVAESSSSRRSRTATDIDDAVRAFEHDAVDGLLVVMLTYGPGERVARALAETRLPICLLNVQPVPRSPPTGTWRDLTYNQGIHGAQDTANALGPRRRDRST